MQNELTELRNQVRTLKWIACLVCCFFLVLVFMGCSTKSTAVVSSSVTDSTTGESKELAAVINDINEYLAQKEKIFLLKRYRYSAEELRIMALSDAYRGLLGDDILPDTHEIDDSNIAEVTNKIEHIVYQAGEGGWGDHDIDMSIMDLYSSSYKRFETMKINIQDKFVAIRDSNGELNSLSKLDSTESPVPDSDTYFHYRVYFEGRFSYDLMVAFNTDNVPPNKKMHITVTDPITGKVWADELWESWIVKRLKDEFASGRISIGRYTGETGLQNQSFTQSMVNKISLDWVMLEFVD